MCVICHNSGLESISKFFSLVINGVYINGSVVVASLIGKTRLLLQEENGCRMYMYFICLSNISVQQHIISTVKAPNIAHLSFLTSIGYNNKETKLKKCVQPNKVII